MKNVLYYLVQSESFRFYDIVKKEVAEERTLDPCAYLHNVAHYEGNYGFISASQELYRHTQPRVSRSKRLQKKKNETPRRGWEGGGTHYQ